MTLYFHQNQWPNVLYISPFVLEQYLLELNCYNTLLAVVGGLNHFSIRRLSQTWSRVDKGMKEELDKRTNFFSSQMNYSTYRQAVAGLNGSFHIPVLWVAPPPYLAAPQLEDLHVEIFTVIATYMCMYTVCALAFLNISEPQIPSCLFMQ